MTRKRLARWAIPALMVAVPLGIMLPALAQRPGERQPEQVNHAKEKVALIEQGQLDLVDATELAEKHVKGNALSAACELRTGAAGIGDRERSGGMSADEDAAVEKRLIYDIICFTDKDEVQTVQVDALTKKVIEGSKTPSRP